MVSPTNLAALAEVNARNHQDLVSPTPSVHVATVSRTVNNFDNYDDLRMALMNMDIQSREDCDQVRQAAEIDESSPVSGRSSEEKREDDHQEANVELDDHWDWTLTNYDAKNSHPPSLHREAERLMNVHSFGMIERDDDSPKEFLDRLTVLGQRLFQVPICTIHLMDIGRTWILAGAGIGTIRQSPRKESWCNHTIQYKADLMVVPDATQDWRFCHSPHVTGAFHLRFYAGASLVSPEGFRLGELCVMGSQPRPGGLNEEERATLVDLANLASKALAERRELNRSKHLLSTVTTDAMAPLYSLQHCLTSLDGERKCQSRTGASPGMITPGNVSSNNQDPKLLSTALVAADLVRDICRTANPRLGRANDDDDKADRRTMVNVNDCVKQLHTLIGALPKQVPVVIAVDKRLPATIVANERAILRGSLHLLSNACTNSQGGQIEFQVVRRCNRAGGRQEEVLFECHDSRALTPETEKESRAEEMRHNCVFSNLSVASHGYDFGSKTRRWLPDCWQSDNSCERSMTKQGTYAWFSIPLVELSQDDCQRTRRPNAKTAATNSVRRGGAFLVGDSMTRQPPDSPVVLLDDKREGEDTIPREPSIPRYSGPTVTPVTSFRKHRGRDEMEQEGLVCQDSEEKHELKSSTKRIKLTHVLVAWPKAPKFDL